MTRHELIARLEAATGPDISLDIAIHSFVNAGKRIRADRHGFPMDVKGYTHSIDAAATLVPAGLRDTLGFAVTVWQAFGEKMNPLLKQSMTYLLSPFALPRSRLEKHK